MKLKFNKLILFVVIVCMTACMIVGCKENNNDTAEELGAIDVVTEETVEATAEAPTEEPTTEPTEEPTEEATEEPTEEPTEEVVEHNYNTSYSENTNTNNTYDEPEVEVVEPTEEPVKEEEIVDGSTEETVGENTEVEEETTEEIEESVDNVIGLGNFKLTAYCACARCCGKSDGITATGTVATQGRTIAVDPSVIPYGTEVIINGNTYIAEDCGGAIKYNKIDIFFDSHQEALDFGVQYADVYIKE